MGEHQTQRQEEEQKKIRAGIMRQVDISGILWKLYLRDLDW